MRAHRCVGVWVGSGGFYQRPYQVVSDRCFRSLCLAPEHIVATRHRKDTRQAAARINPSWKKSAQYLVYNFAACGRRVAIRSLVDVGVVLRLPDRLLQIGSRIGAARDRSSKAVVSGRNSRCPVSKGTSKDITISVTIRSRF